MCNIYIILFGHEREGNLPIYDNMDRHWGHYTKWNKSDKERQIPYDLTYMESKKAKLVKTESRMVIIRIWGVGELGDIGQSYKLSISRWISCGDLVQRIVTTVNRTILYTWKLPRN